MVWAPPCGSMLESRPSGPFHQLVNRSMGSQVKNLNREFASLFPEEVYYSSVSADRSGLLAVVLMALVSGLALVLGPHRSSR